MNICEIKNSPHSLPAAKDRMLGQLTMTPVSLIPKVCHDDLLQAQWNACEGLTNSVNYTSSDNRQFFEL